MIRFYFASSIDGYIATPNGGLDWLTPYQSNDLGFDDFLNELSVVVMGRHSYETVASFGAWPYRIVPAIVLTSKPFQPTFENVAVHAGTFGDLLELLRNRTEAGDVWVEGGQTMSTFLEANSVDLIEHYTVPVAIGSGIPMFGVLQRPMSFITKTVQHFKSGVVKHVYVPVHSER